MKRWLILATVLLTLAGNGATEEPDPLARSELPIVPAERRLDRLIDAHADRPLTDLTMADLDAALDLVSLARQQHAHVERSVRLSWAVPGLGHSINGERGTALAFAAAEAAVGVVTVVAAYWLLPPAVQYRNLNYLQSAFGAVETRWKTVSASELIPTVSAVVTGALLSVTVRALAAQSAEATALAAIETGRIVFEPRPLGGLGR